jgi:cytochrome c-type biogenesis protein CcmH/NrfG
VRLDEHDDAGGQALLEEALALEPQFEPALAALGSLLMRVPDGRTVDPERAARARNLLTHATAVEPDRLESWIALGRAELAGGDPGRAAKALENAWRRAPDRSDLLGWYTFALAENGQHALAASLLRATLLKSADPEDRTSGERYLRQVVEREVWGLANQGKLDEAQARIEAHLSAGPDAELAKSLNETHARIESQIGGRDCVADYNSGIRAANEQKFAEARPLFEKVVASCSAIDPALVEQAKQVLADIAKFEKKKKK